MVVVFAFALAGIASTETNWALLTVCDRQQVAPNHD